MTIAGTPPSPGGRPGSVIRARGREWIVLNGGDDEILRVRPATGSSEETSIIHLALENVTLTELPTPTNSTGPGTGLSLPEPRLRQGVEIVRERGLEVGSDASGEESARRREHLRRAVEESLVGLGNSFLAHAENDALRADLRAGALSPKDYLDQLLLLVCRIIFLLVVEERDLLHPDDAPDAAKTRYAEGYGLSRLRERSRQPTERDGFMDLWEATKIVFLCVANGEPKLALPALGGIFSTNRCAALEAAKLENCALVNALFELAWSGEASHVSRVNWREMAPEDIGSVYEGLLELVPRITEDGRKFALSTGDEGEDSARRTSGSYYTPDSLVKVVLDRALDPLVADVAGKTPESPVEAVLGLSIVDPACGSGHFLLAAARRLASHVTRLGARGAPSAIEHQSALRQVITRCIYGVDLNSIAVDLCKVALWLEASQAGVPLTFLDSHIRHGNALLGATPEGLAAGIPNDAWEPVDGDDRRVASALKRRNRNALEGQGTLGVQWSRTSDTAKDDVYGSNWGRKKFVADAWCASFLWPKQPGPLADAAPTDDVWCQIRDGQRQPLALTTKTITDLAERHQFFHWHLEFPQVFERGGFDVLIGNPPWIAHAGRAAQPLPSGVKRFYECNYESFADYPTTHGMFVSVLPRVLRPGGYLGLVIPSSLSELEGYAPTRSAHDRLCDFPAEIIDFGEGRFPGVTQPCMALVSRRSVAGRSDAPRGEPWPMERPDLDAIDRQLLTRLATFPTVPRELFGERGVQSDKSLAEHFIESAVPVDRFTTPIREGTDVREFELRRPRYHVDRNGLSGRIRSVAEFREVKILIRQTARYPIAAISDGIAFRNSVLAGFELPGWSPEAVVALLNSALIRWVHYQRFRDARQPVMPQVKIGHLRSTPVPPGGLAEHVNALASLGKQMSESAGRQTLEPLRESLDRIVAGVYDLTPAEQEAVRSWHDRMGPKPSELDGASAPPEPRPARARPKKHKEAT